MKLLSCCLLTSSLLLSQSVFAFGQTGHRVVGEIAENHLSELAKQQIAEFNQGYSLAQLSTWPDEIRSGPNWKHAAPWHYVSIEDDETWATVKRNPKGDILEALSRFEKVLADQNATPIKKWQALAFYTHFVGDIHMPLHVGHAHDKGGNSVKVRWFGQPTNLHAVWDSKLIDQQQLSYTEYTQFLSHMTAEEVKQWGKATYNDWANESKALRAKAYEFGKQRDDEPNLYFDYVYHNRPIVERRLQQAGVRLAAKLNQIFANK